MIKTGLKCSIQGLSIPYTNCLLKQFLRFELDATFALQYHSKYESLHLPQLKLYCQCSKQDWAI